MNSDAISDLISIFHSFVVIIISAIILFVVIVSVVLRCDEQVSLFLVTFESHSLWWTRHLASLGEVIESDSLLTR